MNRQKITLPDHDAVIFDMDGTLVDSMWMWKKIDIDYLKRYGVAAPHDPQQIETIQKEIEGMSFTETAIYFKEKFKITVPIHRSACIIMMKMKITRLTGTRLLK